MEDDLQPSSAPKLTSGDEFLHVEETKDADIAEVESVMEKMKVRGTKIENYEIPQEVIKTLISLKNKEDEEV